MTVRFRLARDDLYQVMDEWNNALRASVFVAACGGTALTLYGHKESTKDVDLLVPDLRHYQNLVKAITLLGYKPATGNGFRHPTEPWIIDLYRGQTIFQTELLDPIRDEGNHRVMKLYERIILACINPDDLIISKMFRGTLVDVQDSITVIKAENIDLEKLAKRYKATAEFYYNPETCKKNLGYLITDLEERHIDATPLREMSNQWTP